jgi:hypothetical protein
MARIEDQRWSHTAEAHSAGVAPAMAVVSWKAGKKDAVALRRKFEEIYIWPS